MSKTLRDVLATIFPELEQRPAQATVGLTGPRQVGKATLARQLANELQWACVYASADAALPPGPEWIETQWQAARRQATSTTPVLLVLDELQKVRGWRETLKQLWDNQNPAFDVRYWRDGNCEVDYVVTRGGQTWALEGKGGRSGKLSGMDAFRRRCPKAHGLLIGGNGVPLEEFFAAPPQGWLAPDGSRTRLLGLPPTSLTGSVPACQYRGVSVKNLGVFC